MTWLIIVLVASALGNAVLAWIVYDQVIRPART